MTSSQPYPDEAGLANYTRQAQDLCAALNQIILDRPLITQLVVAAFMAGGHVLLEGLPGLGKTVFSKAFAQLTNLTYKRIQFTPDLLPADITGASILEETPQGRQMRFIPGPVFTHVLLADEINRGSPKTQAALLEAMGEGSVTQLGETRLLTPPFFVLATQNPIELEGTNPLPEAQLDRFALKITVPPTSEQTLFKILQMGNPALQNQLPRQHLLSLEQVRALQQAVSRIFLPESLMHLIARLVYSTHSDHAGFNRAIRYGASPRAALWLAQTARALALLSGRSGVSFEDIRQVAPAVLEHRIILHYQARLEGMTPTTLMTALMNQAEQHILSMNS